MAAKKTPSRKKTSAKTGRKKVSSKKKTEAEKPEAETIPAQQEPDLAAGDDGERLLSQDEIDTLLFGMHEEPKAEAGTEAPPLETVGDVQSYDLAKHGGAFSTIDLPGLDMLNEHFARRFRLGLFNLLRCSVDVQAEPYQATSFGKFMDNLPTPTSLNVVQARPLFGHAMFVLDASLVYTLVDIYFGGTGKIRQKVEGRDFTHTENRVVRTFLKQAFGDTAAVWKSITPLHFQHERSEQSPRFASIYDSEEVVVQSTFSIDLEGKTNPFRIMFPIAMLDPVKESLVSGYSDSPDDGAGTPGLDLSDLDYIPTEIVGEFGKVKLSVADLLALRPGDILPLSSESHMLRAGHLVLGRGRAGTYCGNYALELEEMESIETVSSSKPPQCEGD